MKPEFVYGLIGLLAGVVLMGLFAYKSAPSMMLKETLSKYNFEESAEKFEQAVLDMGWKIPAVHDLQETMHNNGFTVRKVKVFEICQPAHAYKILSRDDERIVSNMMPCRVSIYEKSDGKTYVSWMNTALMGNMMGGIIADVMGDATKESEAMIAVLKE
jgi:uncharacterized protein (DUF302 family)